MFSLVIINSNYDNYFAPRVRQIERKWWEKFRKKVRNEDLKLTFLMSTYLVVSGKRLLQVWPFKIDGARWSVLL